MGCSVTLGGIKTVDCQDNRGGIKNVYLCNAAEIDSIGVDSADQNVITGITLISGSSKFHKYAFRKNSASFTSTLTVSDNGGSSYVSTVLSMSFNKMEAAKRLEMNALAIGELVAIVEDRNGTFFYLGYDEPIKASNGTGETGAARTDNNQYTIELTDESNEYPFTVDSSVIKDIIAED